MNKRIIYATDDGLAVIVPAPECGLTIEEIAAKDVPSGVPYEIVDVADIPSDRMFRNAWAKNGRQVSVDVPKAKLIAHDMRRTRRAAEFAPLDAAIAAQIPGNNPQAVEAQRQAIRDKYAVMQTAIDAATSVDGIKAALGEG